MTDHLLILTTAPDEDCARRIARALLEARAAACVNLLPPMTSLYRWRGQLEEGREHQLLIKTRRACYGQVEEIVRGLHPYELPELIATPIVTGLAGYLNWIEESTQQ